MPNILFWNCGQSAIAMKCLCFIVAAACLISVPCTRVQAQNGTGTAPSFLVKPLNTTAKVHTTVVLNCKITGNPPPTISWVRYVNNRETVIRTSGRFVIGAIFRNLYILGIQWVDAGQYGCVGQNQHGRIMADVHVTVVTDAPPTWHIKPYNVTLYTGQQYTIPCRTYGYPDPLVTWTRNGLIVAEVGVRALLKDLYFSKADPSLTGLYACTASNILGTVSHSIYVQVVPDPSIVTHPQDVFTSRGGTVTLSCGVVASLDSLSVNWRKNDNDLPDIKRITTTKQAWQNTLWYTVKIIKAQKRDMGSYHCTVTNLKGTVTSNAAQVSFSETQVPLKVAVPQPIVITTEESDVELKCVFFGLPIPQVSWYKDDQDLTGIGFQALTAINNRSEAVLRLGNVKQSSAGSYYCRGDSASSSVDGHITLIVRDANIPDILPLKSDISALKGSDVSLKCLLGGSAMPDDVVWYKQSKQVTRGISYVPHPNGTYIAMLDIANVQYDDSGIYTCTVRNQFGASSGNVSLSVKGSPAVPTNIRVNHTSYTTVLLSWVPGYDGGADVKFIVEVRVNTSTAWKSFEVAGNTTHEIINKAEGWKGVFVFRVTAVNQYGSSQPGQVQVMLDGDDSGKGKVPGKHDDRSSPIAAIAGGVAGGTILVVLVIIVVLIILCKKKIKNPPENLPTVSYSTVREDMSSEPDGSGQERCDTYSYVTIRPEATYAMAVGMEYASVPRQKKQWEVPKRLVQLDKELGSGHFGRVMKGFLKTKAGMVVVAVKMLKDNADQQQKKEFLAELELMKSLAPHPNIVGLVGCCSKSEQPYILVEYCTLGNLRDFLRASHGSVVYANMAGNSLTLTSRDLLSFAWQVARGMSYLASQKLVHRDLAARNVLVDKGNVCKIADFGLARDIYEKKQYLKTGEAELPLRWMAIESIFKGVTTTKSDVWSFGILLWEVVTLGANPYPAMTRDQVINQLQLGYRMPKPPFCSDELYSIMWQCWQEDPESRPTFLEVGKTLHRLMTAEKISIDLSNFDVSYINATEEQ